MWEINNFTQIQSFLYAMVVGCIYCIVYDILRALRLTGSNSTIAVLIQDIIYWVFCALSFFCFLLAVTNGELRAYIFIGVILGFVIFRITVSRIFMLVFKKLLLVLKWIFKKISRFYFVIYTGFDKIWTIFANKTGFIIKNGEKCLKKLLKKGRGMLYTSHNR